MDIPIGLRDEDATPRQCDIEARKRLGQPRGSSVFPAPMRTVLLEETYPDALRRSRMLSGKGLSKQAFAIAPKIREVDALMCADTRARAMIREVHPEVCFWGFAGGVPMRYRKKLKEGFAERMEIIESILPGAKTMVDCALSGYKRSEVARDDIVDALVAVATAASPTKTLRTLPSNPPYDSTGLPMEMVYCRSRLGNAV